MKPTIILLFFALTSLSFNQFNEKTRAGDHKIDIALEKCIDENPYNLGIRYCRQEAFEAWDVELNRVYKLLRNSHGETGQAALKSSQLAWLSYRDKEYKFIENKYLNLDGSMYPGMEIADKIEIVRNRTLVLLRYLNMMEN